MVRRAGPLLIAALVVGGCAASSDGESGSQGWRCEQRRCEVTVTGAPTVEALDARLKARVSGGRVRLSGGGVTVTLNPGEAAMVDGVRVEVVSVDGRSARLVLSE